MARHRGTGAARTGRGRRWATAALFVGLAAGSAAAAAPAAPQAEPKARTAVPVEVLQSLDALSAAQRSLAESVAALRDQVAQLQHVVDGLNEDLKDDREQAQEAFEHDKQMREEVRGLYVEASSLKGDVAEAATKVETLDASLGSFRLSAGIVAAVVILLQVVIIGLMFRGRG